MCNVGDRSVRIFEKAASKARCSSSNRLVAVIEEAQKSKVSVIDSILDVEILDEELFLQDITGDFGVDWD